MRIFQVLEHTANGEVGDNQTWYRNLHEPLIDLGHEVVFFSAKEGRMARQHNDAEARARFSQNLLELFLSQQKQKRFDLFFAYLMDGMVETSVLDEIRKTGVPTCNFSCNNAHQIDLVQDISTRFDYMLHSERDARKKFLALGANPVWWPMASNPKYFKPVDVPRTVSVSFVGACYGLRPRYVAHLLEQGIDVHAYGPGWRDNSNSVWKHYKLLIKILLETRPAEQASASGNLAEFDFQRSLREKFSANFHLPVTDDELIELYSRSRISLGFLEVYDKHDPSKSVTQHLHLREFEAPMSGALYCTTYSDELAAFFEPEKEVVTYQSRHELADKIAYYLTHTAEADRIRQAGLRRALKDHTYQRRFDELFRAIGLTGTPAVSGANSAN